MGVRLRGLTLAGLLLLLPLPVAAQTPAETAIRDWITAINTTPDWVATYRGLTYDAEADTAVLRGLTVRTVAPGANISFETITIVGYRQAAEGGFSTQSITADAGTFEAGFMKAAFADIDLDALSVPALPDIVFDADKPYTSIMRAYGGLAETRLARGSVGSLDLIEEFQNVVNRISYGRLELENIADGKIANMRAGPLSIETPSPQGLTNITIASIESHNADLSAYLHVYDPDNYRNGVGDMVWRNAADSLAYRDIRVAVPGARAAVREVSAEDIRLRQPPQSFAPLLDAVIADPDMSEAEMDAVVKPHLFNMLAAFGIGRLAVDRFELAAAGIDHVILQGLHFDDFSLDGLGEFAIEGLDAAVEDQGAIKLARFAIGGIVFPGLDVLSEAMTAEERGTPVDPKTLAPLIGFVEVAGLDFETIEIPRVHLGGFTAKFDDYVGPMPTAITTDLTGLDLPADLIDDPEAKQILVRLGYERIIVNTGAALDWDSATETVAVDNFHVSVADMGGFTMDVALAGLPRAAIEAPETLETVLPTLSLVDGRLTFKDDTIVGKSLDLLAERMNAPPEQFRQQFAAAMPFLLSMATTTNPGLMAAINKTGLLPKLIPVVRDFVAEPGSSITVVMDPPAPVPLPAIRAASEGAPDTLITLLGLSVEGSPAPPPAEEPAPSTGQQIDSDEPADGAPAATTDAQAESTNGTDQSPQSGAMADDGGPAEPLAPLDNSEN